MVAPLVTRFRARAAITVVVALAGALMVVAAPVARASAGVTGATERVIVALREDGVAAARASTTPGPATAGSTIPLAGRVIAVQPALRTAVADVDPAQRAQLARDPRVVSISANRILEPAVSAPMQQIGADVAWNGGFTGTGQTVAIVDTGVDTTHPMLAGRVVDEACFTAPQADGSGACPNGLPMAFGPGAAVPCSVSGCAHGTHVASIAAGGDFNGLRGVAPAASVLAVQVFSPTDFGPRTDIAQVLDAFEWVYEQRARFAISAINLSVASTTPVATPCADAPVQQAIDQLSAAGIAVVVAAGNSASSNDLSYPACVPGVISVGSVSATDVVSSFSNRGPSLTLFAPGESITAAAPGSGTQTISGTSQSAPHVAGAIALLRQQQPQASLASIVALLDRTADTVSDGLLGHPAAAGVLRIDRALDPQYQNPVPVLSRVSTPFGQVESITAGPGVVDIVGWALDPASVVAPTVTIRVDGAVRATVRATGARPDVALLYPGYGIQHGFSLVLALTGGAAHDVCVDIVGDRALQTTRLACATVTGPSGSPLGSVDVARVAFGSLTLQGWAIDPDVALAIAVHVYIDGRLTAVVSADRMRIDVGIALPHYGAGHGFDLQLPIAPGSHQVCVYGIDVVLGANALIGCQVVMALAGAPFGSIDVVRDAGTNVAVAGWAIDPDHRDAVAVHVYVDGALLSMMTADGRRTDVGAAYPDYGADHGFAARVALGGGTHVICIYAIDIDGGPNPLIGCRSITAGDRSPFGALDVVTRGDTTEVFGWAIDPDTDQPIEVHVYVDGRLVAGSVAGDERDDVGAAYPGYGADHGFHIGVPNGHTVCVYGINVGPGSNQLIGCRAE